MGLYIEKIGDGDFGKAEALLENHGAVELCGPRFIEPGTGWVTVCCARNPDFEVAGIAYDQEEFARFVRGAGDRPLRWLKVSCPEVRRLAPDFDEWVSGRRASI